KSQQEKKGKFQISNFKFAICRLFGAWSLKLRFGAFPSASSHELRRQIHARGFLDDRHQGRRVGGLLVSDGDDRLGDRLLAALFLKEADRAGGFAAGGV